MGQGGTQGDEALRRSQPAGLDVAIAGDIRSVFQPIVSLPDGAIVGWEALARGPAGSELERPDRLFAAARACGRVAELDWACRAAALAAAERAGAMPQLFLNVEPEALGTEAPAALAPLWARAGVAGAVVELTERALAERPGSLVRRVASLRRAGWRIALDDVGARTGSLALLPLIAPDIVKLDLRLVQQRPTREVAAIVNAVRAHQERTGAHVVAEGIETDAHLEAAVAMGATLGQGWRFGRPGPPPAGPARDGTPLPRCARPFALPGRTPFETIASRRRVRRATVPLMLAMSRHLEDQAAALNADVALLASFQDAARLTPSIVRRYGGIAERAALVAVVGAGLERPPIAGAQGAGLAVADPLAREWSVVIVGHHFAAALAGRDLGETGRRRRFDFAISYDRDVAAAAASTLLLRVAAAEEAPDGGPEARDRSPARPRVRFRRS